MGYSFADLHAVVKEAAMGPVRKINPKKLAKIDKSQIPPV